MLELALVKQGGRGLVWEGRFPSCCAYVALIWPTVSHEMHPQPWIAICTSSQPHSLIALQSTVSCTLATRTPRQRSKGPCAGTPGAGSPKAKQRGALGCWDQGENKQAGAKLQPGQYSPDGPRALFWAFSAGDRQLKRCWVWTQEVWKGPTWT